MSRQSPRLPVFRPERDEVHLYQDSTMVKLPTVNHLELGRQTLRRLGILEIRMRVKEMFPQYSRREVRQLAMALHKKAWDGRDVEAVRRVTHP